MKLTKTSIPMMKKVKYLCLIMLLFPSFLVSDSSTKTLLLERSARVIASYFGSFNPNENLFEGTKGIEPIYPKDLFNKNFKIDINEEHSLSEIKEKTLTVQGIEEFSDLFDKRKLDITTSILGACASNCCSYPTIHGINHNHIYLHEVCFIFKENRPYLKSILLYNGD